MPKKAALMEHATLRCCISSAEKDAVLSVIQWFLTSLL
jgi:hypothetical protein